MNPEFIRESYDISDTYVGHYDAYMDRELSTSRVIGQASQMQTFPTSRSICIYNGLTVGGLEPRPFERES